MKKFGLLMIGIIIFNISAFSQQKNLSQKDSTIFKAYQFNNFKISDSTVFGKNNHSGNGLTSNDPDERKSSADTSSLKIHRMPIFVPKGNYTIRLKEIDTTLNYSLRIIEPEKKE